MEKDIKAVLFDLDGTLTDTEKVYQAAWNRAASKLGYDFFTPEDGLMLRSAYSVYGRKILSDKFGDRVDYDAMHDLTTQYSMEAFRRDGVELKPYAKETLTEVKKSGLTVAIVTATQYDKAIEKMASCGLTDYADLVISAHQAKRGKPYPDPYIFTCERLGVNPKSCVAVEDSPNGVKSAYAAGCQTIMIPDLTPITDDLKPMLVARYEDLRGICEYITSA